jgi:cytochrome oxidase Cu insertion factor (SCO1/SenC/PrrC family)
MRRLVRAGLILSAAVLVAVGCENTPTKSGRVRVGQPAPEIEGEDQDGKPLKLSDYRGKVVLLDFWASW